MSKWTVGSFQAAFTISQTKLQKPRIKNGHTPANRSQLGNWHVGNTKGNNFKNY